MIKTKNPLLLISIWIILEENETEAIAKDIIIKGNWKILKDSQIWQISEKGPISLEISTFQK